MENNKVKFGFLFYSDILPKIQDGILDQYDVVFTKDTRETYIISQDLEPIAIRNKVYVFSSIQEAEETLNKNTDTYVGQIVSILDKTTYKGFIVDKKDDTFFVIPLCDLSSIDYDILGNKPIINLKGASNNPIIISSLTDGLYSISGHYKIAKNDFTVHLNPNPTIFIIKSENEIIFIKKIATKEIVDYEVSDNSSKISNRYVTEIFLKENGYITSSYVDEKIIALGFLTKEDVEKYIEEVVPISIGEQIVPVIDERIDKKILSATEEQIIALFKI